MHLEVCFEVCSAEACCFAVLLLSQVRPELREALAEAMFAVLPITDVSADLQPPPEPPQLAALRVYPRAGEMGKKIACPLMY